MKEEVQSTREEENSSDIDVQAIATTAVTVTATSSNKRQKLNNNNNHKHCKHVDLSLGDDKDGDTAGTYLNAKSDDDNDEDGDAAGTYLNVESDDDNFEFVVQLTIPSTIIPLIDNGIQYDKSASSTTNAITTGRR